jgi:hypothetical protein
MPRPISWLPRLHEISRSVANSVRSHYDRRDLEALFALQPRAAQKLLEILPAVQIGTSKLIDRQALATFLERVREAEDVTGLLEQIRQEKQTISRRRPRSLVRRDLDPVGLTSLPDSMHLTRGQLTVSFQTVEQLAENMLLLARILEDEGDEFARNYEPQIEPLSQAEKDERAAIANFLQQSDYSTSQ